MKRLVLSETQARIFKLKRLDVKLGVNADVPMLIGESEREMLLEIFNSDHTSRSWRAIRRKLEALVLED